MAGVESLTRQKSLLMMPAALVLKPGWRMTCGRIMLVVVFP